MILGIIPARGGSSITDKNIRPLCGKPMIEYTILAAKDSQLDDWFVYTDKYTQYKTWGIARPTQLSQGEHGSVLKWLPYAIRKYEDTVMQLVDYVCLLQPTSPLRTCNDIDNAIHTLREAEAESLYSGYIMRLKTKEGIDSKTKPYHFQRNGAIFIASKRLILQGKLWDEDVVEFTMPHERSIDIDTEDDLREAECLLKGGILDGHS